MKSKLPVMWQSNISLVYQTVFCREGVWNIWPSSERISKGKAAVIKTPSSN